jgi:hypothetical protein
MDNATIRLEIRSLIKKPDFQSLIIQMIAAYKKSNKKAKNAC